MKQIKLFFLSCFILATFVFDFSAQVVTAVTIVPAKKAPAPISIATVKKVPPLTTSDLIGRFLLQKESYNKFWYADPITKKRYYIQSDADLQWVAQHRGKAVTASVLASIPTQDSGKKSAAMARRFGGLIVFTKEKPDSLWYVDWTGGFRYPASNYNALYSSMKTAGVTVDNKALRLLTMNSEQVTYDASFPTYAYAMYNGSHFADGLYENQILPLASVSKIMTAMVLLDLKPDWEKVVTITEDEIKYPQTLVGDDATSEVPIKTGDKVALKDLWASMLLASSNQSAVILSDNSGVTHVEFIKRMNDKAASFGLKKTVFHDVTGLDVNNISTPKEAAMMAQRAFSKYTIVEATSRRTYSFPVTGADGTPRTINVANRNASLLAFEPDASKTGFLVEAQRNVVMKKGNVIIAIMHALSMKQRNAAITRLLASTS